MPCILASIIDWKVVYCSERISEKNQELFHRKDAIIVVDLQSYIAKLAFLAESLTVRDISFPSWCLLQCIASKINVSFYCSTAIGLLRFLGSCEFPEVLALL